MKSQPNSKKSARQKETPILFGFLVQRRGANGRLTIGVRWGRLVTAFVALFVAAWLSAAGALYFYFKYRKDFDVVSYAKMVQLPFRLDEHRKEMGNYHIEKGIAAAKAQNYRDALRLLRIGLLRAPGNLEGRILLAEFYEIAFSDSERASELLVDGLKHGGKEDIGYLRQTFRTLLRYQMDEKIQTIADDLLKDDSIDDSVARMTAYAAANANYLRGSYDRAEDYISDYSLLDSIDGILLSASISWDRGQQSAAVAKLEQALVRFPNAEQFYLMLSRYHREMDDLDEARRYAVLRNLANPLSPRPRIELLYIYNKSGDSEREKTETRRILRQFRNEPEALLALANFAAETANIGLARRTYEEALENEFQISAFALLLIEAHLVAKDYEGALSFSDELLKERPEWLTDKMPTFNSLRAVASFGINRPDLGEIYLKEFLNAAENRIETLLAVSRRLVAINRPQQAREVLAVAYQNNPNNQLALTELIRVELELGNTENLDKLLTKLLKMRRPSIELLQDAYAKLGSDRFIFTSERESLLLQLYAILKENEALLRSNV